MRRICEQRRVVPRLAKVLVARGALLPVPAGLIHQGNRSQEAQTFHGKGDVRQVRNGPVTVLEIKGVQELLGALGADFFQRFPQGERTA